MRPIDANSLQGKSKPRKYGNSGNFAFSDLDAGQLGFMWDFLKLRKENSCTKEDVRSLKENLDKIRLALVQKTAGQRRGDSESNSVNFGDLGTYVNFVVMDALALYIYGGLDVLENVLPELAELERVE